MVRGRRRSNHITIRRRVTKIAVKTDVAMPHISVTAKPFTGPEPSAKRITAVIPVVTLASMMADSAR